MGERRGSLASQATSLFPSPMPAAPGGPVPSSFAPPQEKLQLQPKKAPAQAPPAQSSSSASSEPWYARFRGPKLKENQKLFVDLKTPLANERTLIRWFRSAVLLASVSALLMVGDRTDAQINGIVLGIVALLFVALPAQQFYRRSMYMIKPESKQPKVDRTLPWVISYGLVAALAATIAVSVQFRI